MQTKFLRSTLIFFVCIAVHSCTSLKPYFDKSQRNWKTAHSPDTLQLKYSVFLIGDAGKPDDGKQEPTFKLLQSQLYQNDSANSSDTSARGILKTANPKDVVVFLGDNIYESGLPEPDASDRKEKERRITEQMNAVKDFKGRKIIIPGNHDWNESLPGGLSAINRQEEFVENYLNSGDVFLPSNGCGGPVELQLNDDLVVIVIDSEWWLYKYDKPLAPDNDCTAGNRLDIIQQVEDIVLRNKGKNIVLTMHHPLFSNGRHGGYFSLLDYLFPLTLVRDNLFIPLPVFGAVYPLLRQYGVSRQDLSNKDYQQLKSGLLTALGDEKNVVIATGHEHAFQYNKINDINHILSGAGSKSTSVIKGNDALFAYGGGQAKGFARLNYYNNGQCWVEFWQPEGDGSTGKIVYRTPLYSIPKAEKKTEAEKLISYKDSVKTLVAGEQYDAGKFKRTFFGEHYRDTWATPITIKYLDINNFAGGLTPIKMGGGKQTTSLQFQGKDGNIYQFRTVDKNPAALLPESFLKTFAEDIVQDQISSAHPYGALMIPDMAKAIGIYYTNPQLVYMPYSTLLGPYLQQVGGKLGIIEARPDEDVSDFKSFGNAKNAVSTAKMYKELREDNDDEVDQEMFLKSRLFDLLIGDWDRHEDQWRWAEFKKEKGSIYRPIPRDRDQAFTKFDGIIPALISTALPDIQTFNQTIGDPGELSIAARNLDRNLLNKLTRADWRRLALQIQINIKDEIIEKAVRKMPAEVFKLSGEEIISKLKSRRNQLVSVADDYYNILSREVTVAGSDKKEYFHVVRGDSTSRVEIFKIDKSDMPGNKIYDRVFNNNETLELNLFALNGKDSILIEGNSSPNIKIRVVGGEGNDVMTDNSNNGRTFFYDLNTEDNTIKTGGRTALRLSDKTYINDYQNNSFKYDKKGFIPSFDFNSDDGAFLGLGYRVKHYGFRKDPYSYDQRIAGNFAPKTNAYTINYKGNFYSLFGNNVDLVINSAINGPKYTFNYYGQGNSTPNLDDDINFYRVRTKNFSFASYLQKRFNRSFKIGIGPGFEYFRVEKPEGKYITTQNFPEKADIENPSKYLTLRSYANVDFVNNTLFPTSGVRWNMEANYLNELGNTSHKYGLLKSDLSFYATPNYTFPVTAAFKFGAATNIGDYKFFQANSLGNNTHLRGYRNNRFSGRSYIYQNSELRFTVTTFRNYLFTGNFGMFGFFDSGKIYSDNPESKTWHKAYGPGVWLNFFNRFMVSSSYGISPEGQYITFKSGLSF